MPDLPATFYLLPPPSLPHPSTLTASSHTHTPQPSPGAQVVHARLEALLPGVEVQGSELAKVGVRHEHVEALALINVCTAVGSHVHQGALLDLPHRLVQALELIWNVQFLHAAVGSHLCVCLCVVCVCARACVCVWCVCACVVCVCVCVCVCVHVQVTVNFRKQ